MKLWCIDNEEGFPVQTTGGRRIRQDKKGKHTLRLVLTVLLRDVRVNNIMEIFPFKPKFKTKLFRSNNIQKISKCC